MTQQKSRRIIATLGILLVVATVAGSGVVYAQNGNVDRSIADEELAPGETTIVTVDIPVDEQAQIDLTESFSPAFADVQIVDRDDGFADATDDQAIFSWEFTDDRTVEYEVTVPEDAEDGDEYTFSGTAEIDGEERDVGGDTSITVSEPEEAAVSVSDQSSTGDSVVVDSAVPGDMGESLGIWTVSDSQPDNLLGSASLTAVLENEPIALEQTLETDQEVFVAVHSGSPATDNLLVSDTASISIETDETPDDDMIERDIEDTEIVPGDSTTVTVSVDLTEEVSEFNWDVGFSPAFAEAKFIDDAGASFPTLDADKGLASWTDIQNMEFSYKVTVPDDSEPGDVFSFDAQISGTVDEDITGDNSIEIIDPPEAEGSIHVEDQGVPNGDKLLIDEATATLAYVVVIEDSDGAVVGTSEPLEADEQVSNFTVAFDEHLDVSQNVVVKLAAATEDGDVDSPIETAEGPLETEVSMDIGADAYADDGEFGSTSVFSAIEDWRAGEIGPELVFEVIENWR